MSTRSAIVRLTSREPVGWSGRYHHWDSYPSGLGRTLWSLYHAQFGCDLGLMLKVLIDEHPAGWSTIVGADFTQEAGFQELRLCGDARADEPAPNDPCGAVAHAAPPQCYCHGERSEAGWEVTQENAAGSGCEYVYAFPPTSEQEPDRMLILSSYIASGHKMVGMFGMGDPQAQWRVLAEVLLQDTEPDWERLDVHAWDAGAVVEA
jgi:hypothetical protein